MSTTKQQIESLKTLNQGAGAWLSGLSTRTFRDTDCPRNLDGSYSGRAICEWTQRNTIAAADPLLAGGSDSAGLERYRLAKAALAELELAERGGSLLDKAKTKNMFTRVAAILRTAGDRIQKRFGNDGAALLNDAIQECLSVVNYELGNPDNSADSPDTDP